MSDSQEDRHSLKRAFGLSVGLHALLGPLFVVVASLAIGSATMSERLRANDTTVSVSYLTIERRSRPVQRAASAAARQTRSVVREEVVQRQTRREQEADRSRPQTALPRKTSDSSRRWHRTDVRERLSAAVALASAEPQRAAPPAAMSHAAAFASPQISTPSPAPPDPSATPLAGAQEVAARGVDVPPGGWGQSFEKPIVADETAIANLRARYHATATIDVDESGHATHVTLPANLSGEARTDLEKLLLELRYVPAECNGLRCTGTLQVVL